MRSHTLPSLTAQSGSPSSFVIFPSSTVARTPQLAWEAKHKALLYSTFDMVAFFLSCSRRFLHDS